jgi:ribonuclease P protein subunit POP4
MTPESLPRHELAGLRVEVVAATDESLVGLAGEVVDETTNTLLVEGGDGLKQVPKAVATFEFVLPSDDASGGEPRAYVVVEGERLVARPARRTERTGDSTWR